MNKRSYAMRTSLLLSVAGVLFAASTMLAQRPTEPGATSAPVSPIDFSKALLSAPVPTVELPDKEPSVQALTYKNHFRSDFYPSFETFTTNKVLQYDPTSNTLVLIRNNRLFDQTGNLTGGQVRMMISTDKGLNFTEAEVFNKTGTVFAMPSFAMSNPGNVVTNPLMLNFTIFGFYYEESLAWRRGTGAGIFKATGTPFDYPMEGPEVNNNSGFTWNDGDIVGLNGDNPSAFFTSMLSNANGGQYGTYGQFTFDYTAEDFVVQQIPTAWDVTQFRDPGTTLSTYNGQPRVGSDDEGRMYMIVNNIMNDNEELRIPCFSTSEDQGVTWSAFTKMPESLYEAYRTQYGWDNITVYQPYQMEAFVVTGVNKFSYFFRVGHVQSQAWANIDIVEASYDGGTWSLTRVAELAGFPLTFTRQDSISDLAGQYEWKPAYQINPLGHELEVAITADKQSLLVKWIDDAPVHGMQHFNPVTCYFYNQQTARWVEDIIDSLYTTDIFYSYRNIGDPSWGAAVNISNDLTYDHGTRIPPVIPSLTEVPLMTLKTIAKSEYNQTYPYLPAINSLPDLVLDAHVDYRTPNTVRTATPPLNAINPSSVKENEESYAFRFVTVGPNPTQDETEITYTLDVPGTVSLDVYSTTGERVQSLFNGNVAAGLHGVVMNASQLANGAYYVVLSVNGKQITEPLSVIK